MNVLEPIENSVDYLIWLETEESMQEITEDLEHIGYIWQKLASYIHDQGKSLESTDQKMETIESNVKEGTDQIEQAVNYAKDKLIIVRDISLVIGGGILGTLGLLGGPIVGAGTVVGGAAVGGAIVAKLHLK